MTDSGETLFRWRSYLPLVFVPGLIFAAAQGEPLETALGEGLGDIAEIVALALVLAGVLVRALTVGFVPANTSGRNTIGQVADALNVTGAYSLCRNPLYLGNCMIYVGAALFAQDLWLTAMMILALALYYERIISAEESFLKRQFGGEYLAWAGRTPAFFPRLSGWSAPNIKFSLLTVIRREQATWLGAIFILAVIGSVQHLAEGDEQGLETGWIWTLAAGTILYIIAFKMKRVGKLNVEGR